MLHLKPDWVQYILIEYNLNTIKFQFGTVLSLKGWNYSFLCYNPNSSFKKHYIVIISLHVAAVRSKAIKSTFEK